LFDLFTLQESKIFLISIGESRRDIKPRAHSQSFDNARLKELASNSSNEGGKARFQALRRFPSVEMWGKRLSKMEEVLIMGLIVRHLDFSINKCFQAGKWVTNHTQNSTTLNTCLKPLYLVFYFYFTFLLLAISNLSSRETMPFLYKLVLLSK
jgi:hypothetical protein